MVKYELASLLVNCAHNWLSAARTAGLPWAFSLGFYKTSLQSEGTFVSILGGDDLKRLINTSFRAEEKPLGTVSQS
jgi:hypothetical protein